jgi:transcriptional regulator with XRE-family HTH domain
MPDEPDELPAADAVVVAPATFNTVNKWAAGITDTFAAGRSESWLSQVERGLRPVDSHSVLVSLAEILRVDVGELTGNEPGDPRASQYAAAREIERAMVAYDALESVMGPTTTFMPRIWRAIGVLTARHAPRVPDSA